MDDELPEAEVLDPEFKQIELTPDEQDLYGTCLMNLINSSLSLIEWVNETFRGKPEDAPQEVKDVIVWATEMNSLVNMATAKAGLGMPQ